MSVQNKYRSTSKQRIDQAKRYDTKRMIKRTKRLEQAEKLRPIVDAIFQFFETSNRQ